MVAMNTATSTFDVEAMATCFCYRAQLVWAVVECGNLPVRNRTFLRSLELS